MNDSILKQCKIDTNTVKSWVEIYKQHFNSKNAKLNIKAGELNDEASRDAFYLKLPESGGFSPVSSGMNYILSQFRKQKSVSDDALRLTLLANYAKKSIAETISNLVDNIEGFGEAGTNSNESLEDVVDSLIHFNEASKVKNNLKSYTPQTFQDSLDGKQKDNSSLESAITNIGASSWTLFFDKFYETNEKNSKSENSEISLTIQNKQKHESFYISFIKNEQFKYSSNNNQKEIFNSNLGFKIEHIDKFNNDNSKQLIRNICVLLNLIKDKNPQFWNLLKGSIKGLAGAASDFAAAVTGGSRPKL